jgi:hypothetical protein
MRPTKLQFALTLFLLIGMTALLPAQVITKVAEGIDGISAALATTPAGGIVELTTSGGQYIETKSDTIAKNVTIRAAAGLAKKPVILSGAGDATLYLTTGSLTISGVKFDGLANGTPFGYNFLYWKAPATGVSSPFNLKVDNCEFYNCQQRVISNSDGTLTALDSLIVKNSIFKNTLKHPFYLKATRNSSNIFPGAYKYALLENLLMVKTNMSSSDGYATYIEPGNRDSSARPYPKVIINHVTVDSCMGGGINTYTTSDALVQNCIVTNSVTGKDTSGYSYALESGRWVGAPASNLKNSLYFNANPPKNNRGVSLGNSAYSLAILTNVQADTDPMFNNPAALDYSLKTGSPAKSKGTDGKDLGYIAGGIATAVESYSPQVPESFLLSQNYPNPFNPSTLIQFAVPKAGRYSLKVFTVLGQEVATLYDREAATGTYTVNFNASNLPSGVYFYTLKGDNVNISKKMVLVR